MKRVAVIALIVLLVTPWGQSFAQDGGQDCDPDTVQTWLIERTKWVNASSLVLESELSFGEASMALMDHLEAIEQLPRPACLDGMMILTYQGYANLFQGLTCAFVDDTEACTDRVARRVEEQRIAAAAEYERFAFDPAEYAGQLPHTPTPLEVQVNRVEGVKAIRMADLRQFGDTTMAYLEIDTLPGYNTEDTALLLRQAAMTAAIMEYGSGNIGAMDFSVILWDGEGPAMDYRWDNQDDAWAITTLSVTPSP